MMAGRAPLITSGFYVLTAGITIATNLKIRVADSSLIHFKASESGSIFHVPADRADEQLNSTNPRVLGSFTPSQVNYVGLDFVREADDSTTDLVEFIDTQSLNETPVSIPLARTTDYRIVISTLDFDNNPGVAPICKVTVDGTGNITEILDAREQMFRLGDGGTVPNIYGSFPWPDGRKESLNTDVFTGGDKGLSSLKSWMDGIMSRLWEVGGGEFWYSPTAYGNERLARQGSPFVSNGEFFEWDGLNLHWKGLVWIFANSSAVVNEVADITVDTPGLTDLLSGECIYVDVDRTTSLTGGSALNAVKGTLANLGSPTIPGTRYVIAWAYDSGSGIEIYTRDQSYAVNSTFKNATVAAAGMVTLSGTPGTSSFPAAVATVDDISYFAFAGGLSRAGDFVGGAGDIQIGGFSANDQGVKVITNDAQYETQVTGVGTFANAVAAFSATNTGSGAGAFLSARFRGVRNVGTEDTHHFFNDGALGWCNVLGDVTPDPAPSAGREIRSKTFFCTNGLATPNTRDRFCIKWFDGSLTVIAESPTY
jgi:hypothetical protein